ncbi:YibE/F family protein [Pseudonocardia sp. DLS-67]
MPADDPDQTTGVVRARRAPGRHRTERPAEPPRTPEVGFPAVHQPGRPPDRPRHAMGGRPVTRGPATRDESAYDDWHSGSETWADGAWADGWNGDDRPGDPRGAAPERGARRRDDGYPDTRYARNHHDDPYAADPYAGPSERDRFEPAPLRPRAAEFDGDVEAGPEPAGPPPDRPDRPRVGGLPHRPGRGPVAAVPPAAMPDRRPGDPPGAPAELFVETTTETPAMTPEVLGRHDEARATAEADADEPPGRPRVFGVPLPFALPAWADRLVRRTPDDPTPGHGHGHGHGPARPAGRRVRILIAALLVPCALATLVGLVLLWPTGGPPDTARPGSQQPVRAQVTATTPADCSPGSGSGGCVALVVHMADGPRPGRDLVQVVPVEPGTPTFGVGDQVVLSWSGADADDAGSYQVVDFQRGTPLVWLAGLFAVAVLVLGRWRGLAALAALGLGFVVLLFFVVPAILAGRDPLAVAVVGACLIMFAVLYLTHGPSARTSTAVLGTLLSLALIGALGAGFSVAARLTGLDDQTSNLIATLGTGVDARGLLLAGVVIGALGVLDDVTVTQTSAVWELRHANPELSARRLFTAAMRIGRDHVASAVNTLVLAYAGAALPLLLLFSLSGRAFGDIVTSQDVGTEIVRTLVGSIGLVASVPITTALAAAVAVRETVPAAGKAG